MRDGSCNLCREGLIYARFGLQAARSVVGAERGNINKKVTGCESSKSGVRHPHIESERLIRPRQCI